MLCGAFSTSCDQAQMREHGILPKRSDGYRAHLAKRPTSPGGFSCCCVLECCPCWYWHRAYLVSLTMELLDGCCKNIRNIFDGDLNNQLRVDDAGCCGLPW
mmetsp:Transcript_146289/g.258380  ORF Transcript_146289/g.258380 Transcript_146289/m.258380 type:complete len:101 (-) Transcript_146289:671-973(-)